MDSCDLLDKPLVLKLNSLWQRLGFCTPRQAFISMTGGIYGGTKPAKGLSIVTDENGNLVEGVALDWDDWLLLPIRDCDLAISTGRGLVRIPSVVVTPDYSGMPKKGRKFSGKALRERDGGVCQVSGRVLMEGEGNVGHIVAKARGGARTWENTVYMDKRLNSLQGTRTPEEMGWTLRTTPGKPLPIPACSIPVEPKTLDHVPFSR